MPYACFRRRFDTSLPFDYAAAFASPLPPLRLTLSLRYIRHAHYRHYYFHY